MSTMPPVFSPDSRKIFYILQDYEKRKSISFVSDTRTGEVKKSRTYDSIGGVIFSPDGLWFAYAAGKEGKQFVVVSDFAGAEKEGIAYDSVGQIAFSLDAKHIAYIAGKQGKRFLVISNREMSKHKEGPPYERLWEPRFSPDGKFVLYGAQSGKEIWWKVEGVEQNNQ